MFDPKDDDFMEGLIQCPDCYRLFTEDEVEEFCPMCGADLE